MSGKESKTTHPQMKMMERMKRRRAAEPRAESREPKGIEDNSSADEDDGEDEEKKSNDPTEGENCPGAGFRNLSSPQRGGRATPIPPRFSP
jgi:hypothetical protein